jgi:UDP-N-acetylmuramate--alanine ligase
MSDYGHHPTEIEFTLDALKQKYLTKKLLVIFQPHQYNRTLNLIE